MLKGFEDCLYEYNGNTTSKILRSGWNAYVNDYAISGGWNYNGEALIICDAAGGVYVFDGKSGEVIWSQGKVHEGGILSTAINPLTDRFVTGGQMEKLLFGILIKKRKIIDLGDGWIENCRGHMMVKCWRFHALEQFMFTLKRVMKYGNLIIITVPSAI